VRRNCQSEDEQEQIEICSTTPRLRLRELGLAIRKSVEGDEDDAIASG
jgi:hypothetical protein